MNKPRNKKLLLLVISLFLLLLPILFMVDYNRALNDRPPLFAIKTQVYKDGGTSIYLGIGYQVIDYNQVDGRKDIVFKSVFVSNGS
ncbi:hypothetical protein [Paenibacillus sp. OAS669]|uniref:hypothetical protein n=1 Tax=Paenibacillus sp. OAS669 TaxID=2663821 RepID=UPI00178A23F3|nr:hypothetical protein [Paenibacillus sp. OAS669]MBE1442663.1 hypothetical protein [Paenibacillus sp. OAS669]